MQELPCLAPIGACPARARPERCSRGALLRHPRRVRPADGRAPAVRGHQPSAGHRHHRRGMDPHRRIPRRRRHDSRRRAHGRSAQQEDGAPRGARHRPRRIGGRGCDRVTATADRRPGPAGRVVRGVPGEPRDRARGTGARQARVRDGPAVRHTRFRRRRRHGPHRTRRSRRRGLPPRLLARDRPDGRRDRPGDRRRPRTRESRERSRGLARRGTPRHRTRADPAAALGGQRLGWASARTLGCASAASWCSGAGSRSSAASPIRWCRPRC